MIVPDPQSGEEYQDKGVSVMERVCVVSVVIPIRNEAAFISATLDGLVSQHYPPNAYEIVVVDGESTDRTREIVDSYVDRFSMVKLARNPRRLSSSARNIGIKASRGDLVLIVDGHCEITNKNYISDLVESFDHSQADCVGRPQPLTVTDGTTLQWAIAAARSAKIGHHPKSFIYSAKEQFVPAHSVAVAYRREVFEKVGYFDERFDACEDVEFNHRIDHAGLSCFFTPKVSVTYRPRGSLKALYKQMVRYGRGRARLLLKHPRTLSLLGFAPAIFLATIVVGMVSYLWLPTVAFAVGSVLLAYSLLVTVSSFFIVVKDSDRRLRTIPLLMAVFIVIHMGAGVGIWVELLSRPFHATPN